MGTSLLYSVLSSRVQVVTAPGTWMGTSYVFVHISILIYSGQRQHQP
jgi:hypothetical protein